MGKKGREKQLPDSKSGSNTPISLREEATGKIQTKIGSNIKSTLRFEHLKKLAVWASNEAFIPSLGSFYGQHLATVGETMGIHLDPSLTTCQRCETVLHPGFNSTVRVEKTKGKVRRRLKNSLNINQNNVVYKCHFCLHQNLKRGTFKGHMKRICPTNEKPALVSKPPKTMASESAKLEKGIISKAKANHVDVFASRVAAKDVAIIDSPATPSSVTTLLEGKKRMRNGSASKKATVTPNMSAKADAENTSSTASKRRRKSWTSLKEIAQSNDHKNNQIANLTIPFFL